MRWSARLFYSLRKRKVPILFDASIVDLVGDVAASPARG